MATISFTAFADEIQKLAGIQFGVGPEVNLGEGGRFGRLRGTLGLAGIGASYGHPRVGLDVGGTRISPTVGIAGGLMPVMPSFGIDVRPSDPERLDDVAKRELQREEIKEAACKSRKGATPIRVHNLASKQSYKGGDGKTTKLAMEGFTFAPGMDTPKNRKLIQQASAARKTNPAARNFTMRGRKFTPTKPKLASKVEALGSAAKSVGKFLGEHKRELGGAVAGVAGKVAYDDWKMGRRVRQAQRR